jgi:signal transduction histidine kinase
MVHYRTYVIDADTKRVEDATDRHVLDISAIQSIKVVPKILEIVCRTTGMGFAAIARVTDDRWIACAVRDEIQFGLQPGSELPLATTICNEIRQTREAVFISNVANDDTFRTHPTPALYGFQSYMSMPIVLADGSFFGTLCAIDPRPAHVLRHDVVQLFQMFADLIALHLRASDGTAVASAESGTAELSEQFLTVLGHDLYTPLSEIAAGIGALRKLPLETRAAQMVRLVEGKILQMAGLVDDVMDFARGRLGGGLTLDRNADGLLETNLRLVIQELGSLWPDRVIWAHHTITEPVDCDGGRVAQLLSNLLQNALTHGQPTMPIRVQTGTRDGIFELSVSNSGSPIPSATMKRLFRPFSRGALPGQRGLGLGLYIASEIARAHGGTLVATSTPEETRFRFQMPGY